jgi:hypothetical protein
MREYLKDLDLDMDTIDIIMAQYGKLVTRDKEEIQTLKEQVKNLKSTGGEELQKKYDELLKEKEEAESKKKDQEMDKNIADALGNKKFVNDYTKNSIISEVKTAMSDEKNAGKSVTDLFKEITKDKEGIFVNPNKPYDMAGTSEVIFGDVSKDTFDKMSYRERVELKSENPELFDKLNSQE